MPDRLTLVDHLQLRLVVVEAARIDGLSRRDRAGAALVDQEPGEAEVFLLAGDAVHLHQRHLGDLVARPRRALAGTEGVHQQIGGLRRDVEEVLLAGRLVVGGGRLEQVAEVVELVRVVALVDPALLAGPAVRVHRIDRPRRVDVAVGLLRGGDLRDHPVNVGVELRIGLDVEDVGCAFDHLVEVGVVERIRRRLLVVLLAAQRHRGALEVVDASRLLALLERGRDRDLAVGLDARRPEDVVQLDGREGHRLDGVVVRRLLGSRAESDQGDGGGRGEDTQHSHVENPVGSAGLVIAYIKGRCMVAPSFSRLQLLGLLALALSVAPAAADPSRRSGTTAQPAKAEDLSNRAFQIKYDGSGITSLKRTGDVADTDYIAANAAFGRLLVRYRAARNGDWKELRDLLPGAASAAEIRYRLGVVPPGLATRASGSAVQGVAGLRGLNDGIVPRPAAGGRGAGPGAGGAAADVPIFTWPAARPSTAPGAGGATQWVRYTFPTEETIGRTEVFWTAAPQSWRVLYQDGGQWKEVAPTTAYGRELNAFTRVDFAPVKTMALRIEVALAPEAPPALAEWRVGPEPAVAPSADLSVEGVFRLDGDALVWTITLANPGERSIEVGDLGVPFPFAERAGARGDIYTKKLLRHALVNGHGSWIYWQRSNAVGPYLVMTPEDGTKFEYFESGSGTFTPYVHASAASAAAKAAGGNWRLPVSALTLAPRGHAGSTVTYSFRFQWAPDVPGVREVLYREGKFDPEIVPGMVVPTDLPAHISLRSRNTIEAVSAEHPSATRIEPVAGTPGLYTATFSRLGENILTVKYGGGRWATLEFFVTEPLETVIRKRAAFLVSHHQHADPSQWYAGMYSDWDQKNEIRRSPVDRDGLSTWLTDANDDAGNARPAFLASKNVFLPDQTEIASLELYISKYLWGGMQMTATEKYPYAIYGIPNFKANRASADEGRNGQAHVWRIYDYPHIVMLYFRMYQIASFYPSLVKHVDAATYLERAYRTAVAYWTVPLAVEKWSADAVGTMNEAFIPDLIDALDRAGKTDWARDLRGHWEGKVERFVNRTPNLYGSEFAFDSTGFESTGSFARYVNTHAMPAVTPDAAKKFTDFQLSLNMADRGWLEKTYYQLGSDYRGNLTYLLSYMSQMGGWSILDHALHFAPDPTEYSPSRLRLVAQFVGAGEFRHRRERVWLLVPGCEQRWRNRRRLHARTARPRLDRQADGAWGVVLQRRGGRRLLRRHAHARHDPRARSDLRRHCLRWRGDAQRIGVRSDPARWSARSLSRRPR